MVFIFLSTWYCFGPLCVTFVTVYNNLRIRSSIAVIIYSFFAVYMQCQVSTAIAAGLSKRQSLYGLVPFTGSHM